ncbi:P-loop containing nucleoside triphosphate hydrolase protein [Thelephora terrestris]|uniref:P-loop containing nucleoside triphosphate hydrolase protein n=1 Tax=Thelephora terrestris TaxID=56493 RepID=A0A9P6L421_9AGAM|nr:P-loop containing nucleoside triphosphate hydrolase protein [Thelephora terrestris]
MYVTPATLSSAYCHIRIVMRIAPQKSDRLTTNTHAVSTSDGTQSRPPTGNPLSNYFQDPPALIAIMGVTGSGKTTFVNQATKSSLPVGGDLESCTSETQVSEEFILDGRRVALIDTPGFDDTNQKDTDVLKSIAVFLGEVHSAGMKLAGVIYVHRISDDRFGGLATKNFRMLKELCGENTLKNVVFMTNMWGRVTSNQGAARERQLKNRYFKAAIEKGAQLCRHDDTPESAHAILRTILRNQPVVLQIQRELIDEGKDIAQTGAGVELTREIREVIERFGRDIKELEECMLKAMKEKDEESRREFAEERRTMQEEMVKLQKESAQMQFEFDVAQSEMRMQVRKIREEYEDRVRELERREHENSLKIEDLQRSTRVLQYARSCAIM